MRYIHTEPQRHRVWEVDFKMGFHPMPRMLVNHRRLACFRGLGQRPRFKKSLCVSVPLCEHVHAFCRLFDCKKLTLFHCRINNTTFRPALEAKSLQLAPKISNFNPLASVAAHGGSPSQAAAPPSHAVVSAAAK